MAEIAGCHGCYNAQWDADGCTCRIDGLLVGNPAKGCTYRIYNEEPETVSGDYERGFKDGLKSECLKELKPIMVELAKGCTEAIKGIAPMLIDNAQLTIRLPVNRWIPVEDALPEQSGVYLAYFTFKDGTHAIDIAYINTGCCLGSITHWMHLPEPPEKE